MGRITGEALFCPGLMSSTPRACCCQHRSECPGLRHQRGQLCPKHSGADTVENANAFGAPAIQNLAPGVRHLFPARVLNANQFGTAQVRVSYHYLVQAKVWNVSQFNAANVHFAIRLLKRSRVSNVNHFRAPAVAEVAATAVSAIVPSDLDTTFVDSDGSARSEMTGGAYVNLDG